MRKTILTVLLGALGTISASASAIAPGQSGSPDLFDLSGLTLVTSVSGPANSITFTANYTAAVYTGLVGGSSVGCAACLTYVYQIADTGAGLFPGSTGVIEHITASYFGGFATDVGYSLTAPTTGGFVNGDMAPGGVSRSTSGSGDVITWDYVGSASDELMPGRTTYSLAIVTDSTTYIPGLFSAIDGSTATVLAFGASVPNTGTPEPATFALFGGALMGLGFLRKRATK